MASVVDLLVGNAARVALHRPWPRAVVTPDMWNMAADHLARGHWILLGLWGEADAVHMALIDEQTSEIGVISLECPDRSYPSIGMLHPPAIWLERAVRDLFGHDAIGLPDTRPWLDHGRWDIARPLSSRPDTTPSSAALPFPACRRGRHSPDPGRPRPCGHHRARPFPLHGKRRDGGST